MRDLSLSHASACHADPAAGPGAVALAILVAPWRPSRRFGGVLPTRDADAFATLGLERLLDALSGTRATVFLDPGWASRQASLARRAALRHEVGVLGFDPSRPTADDPSRGRASLERTLGAPPRWFLPAAGAPCPPESVAEARLADGRRLRHPLVPGTKVEIGPSLAPLLPTALLWSSAARPDPRSPACVAFSACEAADLRGTPGASRFGWRTGRPFVDRVAAFAAGRA